MQNKTYVIKHNNLQVILGAHKLVRGPKWARFETYYSAAGKWRFANSVEINGDFKIEPDDAGISRAEYDSEIKAQVDKSIPRL